MAARAAGTSIGSTGSTGPPASRRVDAGTGRGPALNQRTLAGALLVVLSALGLLAAASSGDDDAGHPVVVAATDLRPGQRLTARDLLITAGELPSPAESYATVDDLVGRVVLGPVGAGEVVQPAAVSADRHPGVDQREVALTLPRDQVAVGRLRIGDRVDVFTTDDERTTAVVRGVPVVHLVAADGDGLVAEREVRLVVAVQADAAVAALVHALRTGEVTVVRSTLATEQAGELDQPSELGPGTDQAVDER